MKKASDYFGIKTKEEGIDVVMDGDEDGELKIEEHEEASAADDQLEQLRKLLKKSIQSDDKGKKKEEPEKSIVKKPIARAPTFPPKSFPAALPKPKVHVQFPTPPDSTSSHATVNSSSSNAIPSNNIVPKNMGMNVAMKEKEEEKEEQPNAELILNNVLASGGREQVPGKVAIVTSAQGGVSMSSEFAAEEIAYLKRELPAELQQYLTQIEFSSMKTKYQIGSMKEIQRRS